MRRFKCAVSSARRRPDQEIAARIQRQLSEPKGAQVQFISLSLYPLFLLSPLSLTLCGMRLFWPPHWRWRDLGRQVAYGAHVASTPCEEESSFRTVTRHLHWANPGDLGTLA